MLGDKSQVVHLIQRMPLQNTALVSGTPHERYSVLIIDAMCAVNMVSKAQNAKSFSQQFINIVADMSSDYEEVRVVFDHYLSQSLKEATRNKRTLKQNAIHYHVNDSTEIKNVKHFLAHINTKCELTKYLSDKLMKHYQGQEKKVLVMHHTTMESNVHCMPLSAWKQ